MRKTRSLSLRFSAVLIKPFCHPEGMASHRLSLSMSIVLIEYQTVNSFLLDL